jgi:hypothetical protein
VLVVCVWLQLSTMKKQLSDTQEVERRACDERARLVSSCISSSADLEVMRMQANDFTRKIAELQALSVSLARERDAAMEKTAVELSAADALRARVVDEHRCRRAAEQAAASLEGVAASLEKQLHAEQAARRAAEEQLVALQTGLPDANEVPRDDVAPHEPQADSDATTAVMRGASSDRDARMRAVTVGEEAPGAAVGAPVVPATVGLPRPHTMPPPPATVLAARRRARTASRSPTPPRPAPAHAGRAASPGLRPHGGSGSGPASLRVTHGAQSASSSAAGGQRPASVGVGVSSTGTGKPLPVSGSAQAGRGANGGAKAPLRAGTRAATGRSPSPSPVPGERQVGRGSNSKARTDVATPTLQDGTASVAESTGSGAAEESFTAPSGPLASVVRNFVVRLDSDTSSCAVSDFSGASPSSAAQNPLPVVTSGVVDVPDGDNWSGTDNLDGTGPWSPAGVSVGGPGAEPLVAASLSVSMMGRHGDSDADENLNVGSVDTLSLTLDDRRAGVSGESGADDPARGGGSRKRSPLRRPVLLTTESLGAMSVDSAATDTSSFRHEDDDGVTEPEHPGDGTASDSAGVGYSRVRFGARESAQLARALGTGSARTALASVGTANIAGNGNVRGVDSGAGVDASGHAERHLATCISSLSDTSAQQPVDDGFAQFLSCLVGGITVSKYMRRAMLRSKHRRVIWLDVEENGTGYIWCVAVRCLRDSHRLSSCRRRLMRVQLGPKAGTMPTRRVPASA